jgi:catechol 2,3-dioxygenase-like lactoylglutathione lyase family enzyme
MSDDIVLNVADPDASARFYAGLLGRRPVEAGPDYAVFLLAVARSRRNPGGPAHGGAWRGG